jgi:osmoprotectant transport system permease protein
VNYLTVLNKNKLNRKGQNFMQEIFSNFIKYGTKSWDKILQRLLQHLQIAGTVLVVSIVFGVLVGYLLTKNKVASSIVTSAFSILYAIPNMAMLAFLIPYTGLGKTTAIIAISIYTQFILLRSVLTGFASVDDAIVEASRGMGLKKTEILFKIQLPLAAPYIFSGIRIAAIAAIGMTTLAYMVGAEGLGKIMSEGLVGPNVAKILWGVLLSSALSFLFNFIFGKTQAYFSKKAHQ